MLRYTALLGICLGLSSGVVSAQSFVSAGASWTGSYALPSPNERSVRLQYMTTQRQLENGFYDAPPSTSYTTNNNYDHSVTFENISTAEGAHASFDARTSEGSGTNSYTVGAVNSSTNTITIDGDGNQLDIAAGAESTGCQNGAITTSNNQIVGGFDISAGATSASASSSSASSVSTGDMPCD
ncbi:hypothetical protein C2I36_11420 [Rhodobacteraceae bacterium WD3A24]|nr:hypothetical protein C2I36_11420 [Rhodobacteraceae bacterium WD3A24]